MSVFAVRARARSGTLLACLLAANLCACGGATSTPDYEKACVAAGAPTTLGPGFVDVSGLILSAPPFAVKRFNDSMEAEPTGGLFGDVDGDGATDVIVTAGNPALRKVYTQGCLAIKRVGSHQKT